MDQIIFHAYPQSPVSEKVRVGFGIKNLTWSSVEVPRIPPKPLLMPLTGGYRRAPVMQIGADVYCDSQGILRELERRFPEPTFYPGGSDGMVWGVSRWTDGTLFDETVKLVLGAAADELPEAFAKDRGRLYLGPNADLKAVQADLAHVISQIRPQIGWMDQRLSGGRKFMLGDHPGLPDAVAYYLIWFIRGRWAKGPEFLSQFPSVEAWEQRVSALGHGTQSDMTGEEALEIAAAAETSTPEEIDPLDPLGLKAGDRVSVVPDVDGGETGVEGPVHLLDRERIAILHEDPEVGRICIHFPRVGYRVTAI
ncbi:glutathione S-transferase family protein [Pelagibius sp. Alg239-R121]|uniref:glutathione S-transferase family protein n=1 Tax=Pelagibius sp. Alg239-R121 TaxID=2993448 RepID=UPI0024A6A58F|nr:glutathione S-transferase family protein [Pelagibius sp. Alg239-R121]